MTAESKDDVAERISSFHTDKSPEPCAKLYLTIFSFVDSLEEILKSTGAPNTDKDRKYLSSTLQSAQKIFCNVFVSVDGNKGRSNALVLCKAFDSLETFHRFCPKSDWRGLDKLFQVKKMKVLDSAIEGAYKAHFSERISGGPGSEAWVASKEKENYRGLLRATGDQLVRREARAKEKNQELIVVEKSAEVYTFEGNEAMLFLPPRGGGEGKSMTASQRKVIASSLNTALGAKGACGSLVGASVAFPLSKKLLQGDAGKCQE